MAVRSILAVAVSCFDVLALNPDWQIHQYGHRAWKIDDGFLPGPVHAVAQDGDGYLWVATDQGLFHFDGVRFTAWTPPDGSQPTGKVLALIADREGGIWLGTLDGVLHWDGHRIIRYKEGQQSIGLTLAEDAAGAVWFTQLVLGNDTHTVLCRVLNSEKVCYGPGDGLPLTEVLSATSDNSGNVWLGTPDSIVAWKNGSATVHKLPALKNNQHQGGVHSFAIDADGSLLVGIGKEGPDLGLQRFHNGQWSPVMAPGFDGSQHRIRKLFVDHHQALWVGTMEEGVYRLYRGNVEHFTSREGLSGRFVESFYEDREGSLWIATEGGFDQFRDLPIQTFSKAIYPKGVEFDNLVALQDGDLWVGGDSTLYTLKHGTSTFIAQGEGLAGKQVTTIFGDGAGRTWIGLDNTLNLFSHGRFTPVTMADGQPTGFIVSMAEDMDGVLWAVSLGPPRALISVDTRTLRATRGQSVNAAKIARDPHAGLWMGSTTGDIMHFSRGTITTVPFVHEPQTWVLQLSVMPNGEVLAASEYGLADVVNNTVHILSARNGLPCSNISDFVFDSNGDLWLYAMCGLMKVDQSQFRAWQLNPSIQIQPRVYDSSDGLRIHFVSFEGAARSPDGKLWFNSWDSLQMIDLSRMHVNVLPPPVHIEGIRADFKEHALAETVKLPPLTRDIEISYTALSLAAPQKIRFRYKLSSFDHDWVDVGARRQAVYMNLSPGTYTFQVIGSNNDGVWNSTGDTLRFTIPPTFYQTAWFRALCALAFLVMLWGAYQLRLRQIESQFNAGLEVRVGERTRIARELHDTLLQSMHGLMFQFQAARNMLPRRPEDAMHTLDGAIASTRSAIAESRDAIHDLRSQSVDEGDLAQLLDAAGAELAGLESTNGNAPTFRLIVEGEPQKLSPELQGEVYRIAREVMRNAFRHSGAKQIEAEIRYDKDQLRLRVRDNGKGIDPKVLGARRPGHWGLPGVRERAERIGGQLKIWSEDEAGTEIELTVPAIASKKAADNSRFELFH